MKNILSLILILFLIPLSSSFTKAQESGLIWQTDSDSLFSLVLENNKTLIAAREMLQSSIYFAGTGNTPPDPEVELGYLTGMPSSLGNRVDFKVSQSFEFPTAYIQRSKAKNVRVSEAELIYAIKKQEILNRSMHVRITRLYLKRMEDLLSKRLYKAALLLEQFKQKQAYGEIGKLELSQANLQTIALKGELEKVKSELLINEAELYEISGGAVSELNDSIFPKLELPAREELIDAYNNSPEMLVMLGESQLKSIEHKLAKSLALPQFNAGYYAESLIGEQFKGFQFGFSIPLWENSRKMKYAKSELALAQANEAKYQFVQDLELKKQLDQVEYSRMQYLELKAALSEINDEDLLAKSLELGEISFSEYIYASEFYFQNVKRLHSYERNLNLLMSDILKIYY
jgi:outer membrane protein TolC